MRTFYPERRQFEAFDRILWKDGYHFTGEVMDPANPTEEHGQGVTHHEIYRYGVQPFVASDSNVLEIGPGRGSWTKALLGAKEVWALDAKSLENNRIMDYLGSPENLRYIQVSDFECADLPDNYFDFLFSHQVFCHIPWDGIVAYMRNLYPKLKTGATGIIHISDDRKSPDKINYGKWWAGCFVPNNNERMSELLTEIGYTVLDPDFLNCQRDSIIKFEK
ncbi:MAG: class I SAM-dependent methyltransferase [Chloroflexi bacterium]|nr:class I SAM-dependent methyltransferase [Chloroflexota bacterium]